MASCSPGRSTSVDNLAELSNIDEFLDLIQSVRNNLFAECAKLLETLPSHQP